MQKGKSLASCWADAGRWWQFVEFLLFTGLEPKPIVIIIIIMRMEKQKNIVMMSAPLLSVRPSLSAPDGFINGHFTRHAPGKQSSAPFSALKCGL
jgi:hypothetical protein